MATETAKFALEVEDGISASAESAEDSLKSLQSQIDRDQKALTQMTKAMRQMQAGSSVDISAFEKLQSEIDATKNSISSARASFVNLGGDFTKLSKKRPWKPKVEKPKEMGDLLSSANALPGPLGKVAGSVSGVRSKVVGLTGAMGLAAGVTIGLIAVFVALVAILVAVAVATARATQKLIAYAAAQADAMRSERLRLEGLGTLRRWLGLTAKSADRMNETINRVAATSPLARSEVAALGQTVHRMGIQGRGARAALEALATAQAVQGDVGVARMRQMIMMTGRNERALINLAARVQKDLGGNAARQMRSLTVISTKLGESFRALFADIEIEPLLTALYRLSQMLSQNTQSGVALREILETLLEPLIGEVASAGPAIERLFEELVILALDLTIAIVEIQIELRRAFGPGIIGQILESEAAAHVFWIALIALAGALVPVVVLLGLVAILAAVLIAPFVIVAAAWYAAGLAAMWLYDQLLFLWRIFSSGAWRQAGAAMIDGIIGGIRDGAGRLLASVRSLGTDALTAFRGVLGIHSPSRVFAELGVSIPEGVAVGVERGSAEAQGAVSSMVTATTATGGGAAGGRSVTIGEIHFHIQGGESNEDTARSVTDALRNYFETDLAAEPV